MEKYIEMSNRHNKEVNALPLFAAFSEKQFEENGVPADEAVYIGGGVYCRKQDAKFVFAEFARMGREEEEAREKADEGWWYEAFRYELANHEYCITHEWEETLHALLLTEKDMEENEMLMRAFKRARRDYLREMEKLGY